MNDGRGTSAADGFFVRSAALLGADALARLARSRVLVVGVGGVGSWCAEALVRTGLGAVALMDDDLVAASNVNRQCPATSLTVGASKVEAMRERLLAVNPQCRVDAAGARLFAWRRAAARSKVSWSMSASAQPTTSCPLYIRWPA